MNDMLLALAITGMPAGLAIGTWLGINMRTSPTDEDLHKFMGRVVNQEEMEEHQRILKYQMAGQGRKTMRFDSGANARVMRMKVRPVSRRFHT